MIESSHIEPAPLDWFPLLRYQRVRAKTGFTIPFLIGAAREARLALVREGREHALFSEVNSLVLRFRDDTPSSHWVFVEECNELKQPLAALYEPGTARPGCEGLVTRAGTTPQLYVHRDYFHRKDGSIESAIQRLWDLSAAPLMQGHFSFRDGHYESFNDEDRVLIENARKWWAQEISQRAAPKAS